MYAQEKERMGILFPFPGFPEKKGNKDGTAGNAEAQCLRYLRAHPGKRYFPFLCTGRKGNKMGIRKKPVKSRFPGLFICCFIPLFPFFIKRKGYARNRKKDAHVLCLCHKEIYAQCTIKIFYYTGVLKKSGKWK